MNVLEALKARKSTRAFLDKPVARECIVRILEVARHAPSGGNAQPWQVAVVSGEKKEALARATEAAFRQDGVSGMDYNYYPLEWQEPYKGRRIACGIQLYESLHIGRKDKARRLEQWVANYRAFDAPVVLFFFLDNSLEKGSYLDFGMFLQSVMLAAVEEGLATCPQAALGQFAPLVKEALGYGPGTVLLCGMALGYEDKDAAVNSYRTPREEVESFTRFFS
ncbi:MAG: nitroreductase [Desulfocapsaceae bacterium]|nr:nitroreductase [Desulfocapsaceae bacterium]